MITHHDPRRRRHGRCLLARDGCGDADGARMTCSLSRVGGQREQHRPGGSEPGPTGRWRPGVIRVGARTHVSWRHGERGEEAHRAPRTRRGRADPHGCRCRYRLSHTATVLLAHPGARAHLRTTTKTLGYSTNRAGTVHCSLVVHTTAHGSPGPDECCRRIVRWRRSPNGGPGHGRPGGAASRPAGRLFASAGRRNRRARLRLPSGRSVTAKVQIYQPLVDTTPPRSRASHIRRP